MVWRRNKKKNPDCKIVITDVRFENEVKFIQSLGGIVFKIYRPSIPTIDQHISEIELQNITCYDYLIENNGSIDDLYSKLNDLIVRDNNNNFVKKPSSF